MSRIAIVMSMALTLLLTACGGGGGGGGSAPPVNGAPKITSTNFELQQDTDLTATLTASDPENGAVTFTRSSNPTHGLIVSFAASGTFTYRPDAGFAGTDSFGVLLSDGTNQVAATVTLEIHARANGAPTVVSTGFLLDQNVDLSVTLMATDPEGETVTFAKSSDPAHGQIVSFAESGAFTYRPDAGFIGTDSFDVMASDGSNEVAVTITLNVRAKLDAAPTITSSIFELERDTDLSATLVATDPEGETVTFAKSSDPMHGQIVSFAASGAFTYRPAAGFVGTDSFIVLASDGTNQAAATITFNVRPNGAPTITAAAFELDHDTDLAATLMATDPEGETVTFAKRSDPAHGQIVSFAESGAFTYRPDAGFAGTDAFGVLATDGTNEVAVTITLDVAGIAQTLSFAQAGTLRPFVGDTLSNPATAPGTGAVTYSSSDPSIATVDAGGRVTVIAPGSVEIGADKASDRTYLAAHASYRIESSEVSVPFSAWVGANESQVTFPATAAGLQFYRSSAPDCDLANFASCPDGQLDILTTASVTDTAATLGRPGFYSLAHGNAVASLAVDAAHFSRRYGHQVVAFQNKLWLIGGSDARGNKNDVWSSSDGVTWIRQTAAAAFSPRQFHQVVVYEDQLWLIGGSDGGSFKNDVWSSADGVTWMERTAAAAFSGRALHRVVVYRDQLWLIGGVDDLRPGSDRNDVWSSSDGITWTQRTASAAFSARSDHAVVVYQDQLWLIGGGDEVGSKNDVWSSSDGIAWTQRSAGAAFSARIGHQVAVYQDRLWLIGGGDGVGAENDVWSSSDGIGWTLQTAGAAFSARGDHQVVVYQDRLWLVGGGDDGGLKNDVWSSSDGIAWTQRSAGAAFSARSGHQAVAYQDQLWVIGGRTGAAGIVGKNDVWSSSDGIAWTQSNASADFSARSDHQVVVYQDQLWLIGGGSVATGLRNDIWSSSDGITWTQRSAGADFSARSGHRVVVYQGQLWLIGGHDDSGLRNDIWSSSDGVTWTRQSANGAFSGRAFHQVVVFANQLWLIGGSDANGENNDVWSSSDGITWIQRSAGAAFSARHGHQVVAYQDRLWLIGGDDADGHQNDVWSSSDGIGWTLQTAGAAFSARGDHQVVVKDQWMLLIGGGYDDAVHGNDVWRSSDGFDWQMGLHHTFGYR